MKGFMLIPVLMALTPSAACADEPGESPHNPWMIEDADAREALPEYRVIRAAPASALTPAGGDDLEAAGRTWRRSNGGNHNLRYSAATEITPGNVYQLRVAWDYRSGDGAGHLQCNPVIADGKLFGPTAGNNIVCIDAAAGNELWRFRPRDGRPAHRGLTWLEPRDAMPARLFFSSGNGLYCLEADTGKPVGSFGSGGRIEAVASTVAPAIYSDLIITAGYSGGVYAYDLASGEERWKFDTIPGGYDGPADENWGPERLGANCWGGTALDAGRGIFYITTGSPKPNFTGINHHGRNLYANCVVAVDALKGTALWHFQEIRHDIWDLDIPAPPNLTTIVRDGKRVDVVTAVTKLGNTLVLDRVSGKPVFDFRLRRAPTSRLPGERTWPYQPAPELPQPFARQTFSLEDVTSLSQSARQSVLNKLLPSPVSQGANMGWFEAFEPGRPTVFYGIHGGAEWTGACVDPESGYLYVTSNELPWIQTVSYVESSLKDESDSPSSAGRTIYENHCMACHGSNRQGLVTAPALLALNQRMNASQLRELLKAGRGLMPAFPDMTDESVNDLLHYLLEERKSDNSGEIQTQPPVYTYNGYNKLLDGEGFPGCRPPWGTLNCLDLNSGKLMWQVPLGEHEELMRRGIPKTGTENFGGATVTRGGLVFAAGTRDNCIRAFDKRTGRELWSATLPFGGFAAPSVYEADGRQFVVIAATGGGKLGGSMGDAYVAFALPEVE